MIEHALNLNVGVCGVRREERHLVHFLHGWDVLTLFRSDRWTGFECTECRVAIAGSDLTPICRIAGATNITICKKCSTGTYSSDSGEVYAKLLQNSNAYPRSNQSLLMVDCYQEPQHAVIALQESTQACQVFCSLSYNIESLSWSMFQSEPLSAGRHNLFVMQDLRYARHLDSTLQRNHDD